MEPTKIMPAAATFRNSVTIRSYLFNLSIYNQRQNDPMTSYTVGGTQKYTQYEKYKNTVHKKQS